VDVHRGAKGPSITLSRSHPGLVRKLFEMEVPEIADHSVEIVALAREAGHRTKIAVKANIPGVNAKGACIGEMGSRVRAVMTESAQASPVMTGWSSAATPTRATPKNQGKRRTHDPARTRSLWLCWPDL
jgi:hypothetical protein